MNAFSRLVALGDTDLETFFSEYWQKKPLLIRQAFPELNTLISPDELAGLSLDDDVTSRLVVENKENKCWTVEHGPLSEARFASLPKNDWSLLVQYADSLDPALNNLIGAFRFMPNWRVDDIMVSFSADGGGVGPHFDYFDVFLLQGEGKKHWRLGQTCSAESALVPDLPMKILQDFHTSEDWILEPGDMLYVPARLAHWGVSIGKSLTYSIGFRAPSHADILLEYSQDASAHLSEEARYEDPDLILQEHTSEITTETHDKIKAILLRYCTDDAKLQSWLGEYATQTKQDIDALLTPVSADKLYGFAECSLNTFCRSSFSTINGQTRCFINGLSWPCSKELAITLCEYKNFSPQSFSNKNDKAALVDIADRGFLEAH